MGVFSRFGRSAASTSPNDREAYAPDPTNADLDGTKAGEIDETKHPLITWRVALMGVLVSMGGLIFGYDTGQISGFLQMKDFLRRYAEQSGDSYEFSNRREGLIVAMVRPSSACWRPAAVTLRGPSGGHCVELHLLFLSTILFLW